MIKKLVYKLASNVDFIVFLMAILVYIVGDLDRATLILCLAIYASTYKRL